MANIFFFSFFGRVSPEARPVPFKNAFASGDTGPSAIVPQHLAAFYRLRCLFVITKSLLARKTQRNLQAAAVASVPHATANSCRSCPNACPTSLFKHSGGRASRAAGFNRFKFQTILNFNMNTQV